MKFLATALAATVAGASLVFTSPAAPAAANVFCPVTVEAVTNLAILGRADTYGVMLDFDAGDTSSVRVRVDSATAHYAVDFNDIGPIGSPPPGSRARALPPTRAWSARSPIPTPPTRRRRWIRRSSRSSRPTAV
jgi:hypothetical protein